MAKVRRELMSGIQEMQDLIEKKVEKHMEELKKKNQQGPVGVVLTIVVQIIAIGFAGCIIWIAQPTSSVFSWHPTLMVLAFMVLMVEALLLFSPWFSIGSAVSHKDKIFWHWFINVCALICAYTGLAVITYNKIIKNSLHYTSWHGLFGIIVCCTLAVQASGGIIEMYPSLLPFKIRKVYMKRVHAFAGTITFMGAMTAVTLSLYSNWFSSHVSNVLIWSILFLCPVTISVIVIGQFIRNHLSLIIKGNGF